MGVCGVYLCVMCVSMGVYVWCVWLVYVCVWLICVFVCVVSVCVVCMLCVCVHVVCGVAALLSEPIVEAGAEASGQGK